MWLRCHNQSAFRVVSTNVEKYFRNIIDCIENVIRGHEILCVVVKKNAADISGQSQSAINEQIKNYGVWGSIVPGRDHLTPTSTDVIGWINELTDWGRGPV